MLRKIFGAYDIRGRYPQEINEAVVAELAVALKNYFLKQQNNNPGKLVLGRDGRLSSPRLYRTLKKTLADSTFKLIEVGLVTTPMFYFLVNHFKASGGVMVTASHNPKNYNGFKIVGNEGQLIGGGQIFSLIKK